MRGLAGGAGGAGALAERWRLVRRLARHPRRSPAELRAFQDACVRRVVADACARVPFWRRRLAEAGVDPARVRGVRDLARLPVTTKAELRDAGIEATLAAGTDPRSLSAFFTSGASGEPFAVHRTRAERALLGFLRYRSLLLQGMSRRDRVVSVVGERRDPGVLPAWARRAERLLGGPRARNVDCLWPREAIREALLRLRPGVVLGLTTVLAHVAEILGPEDRSRLGLRFVRVGGETVLPAQRRAIAEGFGAPVLASYGSFEFDLLAWECRRTGLYHVCDDGLVLEVLRDGRAVRPGEEGEVVATNLHARSMPFLRYRLADVAVRGPARCPCGSPFGTLLEVRGRLTDYLELPAGRTLHAYCVSTAFFAGGDDWVGRYRLVQERPDRVRMDLVLRAPPPPGALEAACGRARAVLGPGVELVVEPVDALAFEPSGKFRVSSSWRRGPTA